VLDVDSPRGAYGFRLIYPEADAGEHLADLIELDTLAPAVTVTWRLASTIRDIEEIQAARVVYGRRGASTFYVERQPLSIHFDLPAPVVPGAFVHPLLTLGISVHARWRGDVTLHAGAFETPNGGWGIMGARQAGKSALLAALAERGCPIVADDLLAVLDGSAWAGPSCVDLRPDAAGRFASSYFLGMVGGRPRHRLSTPPGRVQVPLRGFFVLDWHDRLAIEAEPLQAAERLQWLYRQEYISLVGWPEPEKLLPIAVLPAWRMTRPRDWAATQEVVDRVLEVACGAG